MKINCKLFGRFIEIFGWDEQEVNLEEGAAVSDLLAAICKTEERHNSIFTFSDRNLKPNLVIRVNGRFIIHLNWLDTLLEEGDRVDILILHCGG